MKLLKYKQICIIILFILISSINLCFGGDVEKKSLYEKVVYLEQEKDWMMLTDTSQRVEPSFKRLFKIYFIGPKENKKIDIDLFTPTQWPTKHIGSYSFSPDGSSIAFVIYGYDNPGDSTDFALHSLSIKNSQITNIISCKEFYSIGDICYSPNNRIIYFLGKRENTKEEHVLYSIELQTKQITELINGVISVTTQACSPDGKEIIYETTDDSIAIYNTETRRSRKIAKGRRPAWSPNGKFIAFVDDPKENNFYIIHPDGTGRELFIRNKSLHKFKLIGEIIGYIDGGILWSPDSSYVYYERAATNSILDTAEHRISYLMDVKTKETIRLPKATGRVKSWVGKM